MNTKELAKRYLLLIIGLFFAALGVAAAKHGALGVSPISSVANILSCRFTALSLGWWLIVWNGILILSALLTGMTVKIFSHLLKDPLEN